MDSKGLKSTAKFFTGYLDKHERGDFFINGNTNKTKFRLLGAGPPKRAVEGWLALFDYLIFFKGTASFCYPEN